MTITNGYATLAELRARVGITDPLDTTDDAALERCIEAASRKIDHETGRTFYARTETHYYNVPYSRRLNIEDDDLLTVTTLTNGDGTTIASTEYNLFPLNASPKWALILKQSSTVDFDEDADGNDEGVISVAGTWGFAASAPADIHEACIILASRLFKRKDAIFGVTGTNAVGEAVILQKVDPDVQGLVAGYRRIV